MIDKNDQRLLKAEDNVKEIKEKLREHDKSFERVYKGFFDLRNEMNKRFDKTDKKIDDKMERILVSLDKSIERSERFETEQYSLIAGAERMQGEIDLHSKRIIKIEKAIKVV
ncbi:MAG: hypothetical protein NTW79_03405 [Candidatus Berkelbacteria bacterium]|nr:hypothetical protein [Candidatus Berkelbacteria bacterium]